MSPNYNILFLSALYAFLNNRDTEGALKYLRGLKKSAASSTDANFVGTWNYNIAFLRAYNKNLAAATRHYRKAAQLIVDPEIITQIEDFLCWVIEEEPDKYQLYFCLGFFNWKTKGDVVQAEKDFNIFLAARREGEFAKEKELVEKWIVEMHRDSV